jgi:hypothetical protein
VTFSVQVSQYRSLTPLKGIGIAGQPQPHHYFHHPIHVVGGSLGTGMMLDGSEELAFTTASAEARTPVGRLRGDSAGLGGQAACSRQVAFSKSNLHTRSEDGSALGDLLLRTGPFQSGQPGKSAACLTPSA